MLEHNFLSLFSSMFINNKHPLGTQETFRSSKIQAFMFKKIAEMDTSGCLTMNCAFVVPARIIEFIQEAKTYQELEYSEKEFLYCVLANFLENEDTDFVKYFCKLNKLDEVEFTEQCKKYIEDNKYLNADLNGFLKSIHADPESEAAEEAEKNLTNKLD